MESNSRRKDSEWGVEVAVGMVDYASYDRIKKDFSTEKWDNYT